jgi:hypothetical protein
MGRGVPGKGPEDVALLSPPPSCGKRQPRVISGLQAQGQALWMLWHCVEVAVKTNQSFLIHLKSLCAGKGYNQKLAP